MASKKKTQPQPKTQPQVAKKSSDVSVMLKEAAILFAITLVSGLF